MSNKNREILEEAIVASAIKICYIPSSCAGVGVVIVANRQLGITDGHIV